jgi:antitoxin VapB
MSATAKVFVTGNSQAVRLPKAFRVDVREMWISKNEITGEITLKPKPDADQRKLHLDHLFRMIADNPLPADFLSDSTRRNEPAPNPLVQWSDDVPPGELTA